MTMDLIILIILGIIVIALGWILGNIEGTGKWKYW
ncbi:MAG: photosystem II protein Y [Muribaculaceae bacterium]|nr:photosystem II protein Y [Muribaculaceae bacterium]